MHKLTTWSFILITLSFFFLNTTRAVAFNEGWESSSIGTYTPDMAWPFISGDEGNWILGDTASECGSTPQTAEILSSSGNKSLRLTSNDSNTGCADNVWVNLVEIPDLGLNTDFSIPLTSDTVISFEDKDSS